MPKNNLLIGYCGICCSFCPGYRAKTCPGCRKLYACKIRKCAKNKKIRCCFFCKKFPCKLFEKGFEWNDEVSGFHKNWKPYSKEYVEIFKIKNIQPFIKKQKRIK